MNKIELRQKVDFALAKASANVLRQAREVGLREGKFRAVKLVEDELTKRGESFVSVSAQINHSET